jgi:hypothetical protein
VKGEARLMLLLLAVVPALASAQDFPNRPIRFLVGFVPGGIADLLARSLGQKLRPRELDPGNLWRLCEERARALDQGAEGDRDY